MFEITRWDPFQDMMSLREAMNRLLEESVLPVARLAGGGMETGQLTTRGQRLLGTPAIDIQDQDDTFIVRASLPGVQPDDVRIDVRGNQVTISGQMREEQEAERGNYLLRERRIGQFSRAFTLPTEVNPDAAEATFDNGILALRLPKSEQARTRQIPVRVHGQQQIIDQGQTQLPGQGQQQIIDQGQTQMPGQSQTQMPGQRPRQG